MYMDEKNLQFNDRSKIASALIEFVSLLLFPGRKLILFKRNVPQ